MIKEIKYGPYKGKINELVCLLNKHQAYIENLQNQFLDNSSYIATLRDMVNAHEVEIDDLQMKIEPDKLKPVHDAVKRANKKLDSKLEIAMDALLRIAECLPKTAYTVQIAQQAIDKIKEQQ